MAKPMAHLTKPSAIDRIGVIVLMTAHAERSI
jgi:hypothetical protein